MIQPEHDPSRPDEPHLNDLIARILANAKALIRTEVSLAKREMSENVSRAGAGIALIGVAALIGLVALNAIAVACVMGLAALGIPIGWAALIVSVAFLCVALGLVLIGKARLSADALKPNRTIRQIKSDLNVVKEMSRA